MKINIATSSFLFCSIDIIRLRILRLIPKRFQQKSLHKSCSRPDTH